VWQPRFPQLVFFVEAGNSIHFNKSKIGRGMWKSIFGTWHTGSSACRFGPALKQNKIDRLKPVLL
jgi:hypothetical protein